MLVIRLRRTGRKKQATYGIVVTEKSYPIQGKFVEKVGFYNPTVTPKEFSADAERVKYWISVGAKPTDTVASLLKNLGKMDGMDKFIGKRDLKRKKKNPDPEEEAAAETEAPAETPAEAPAEEAAAPAEEPAKEEAPAEEAA